VKRGGILNSDLMHLLATLGHTDLICVADAGLPIPDPVRRIDLALIPGVPGFLQTVEALLRELVVERALVAREMALRNPGAYRGLKRLLGRIPLEEVPHTKFKARLQMAQAVVRTGEWTAYANVLLQSGVAF